MVPRGQADLWGWNWSISQCPYKNCQSGENAGILQHQAQLWPRLWWQVTVYKRRILTSCFIGYWDPRPHFWSIWCCGAGLFYWITGQKLNSASDWKWNWRVPVSCLSSITTSREQKWPCSHGLSLSLHWKSPCLTSLRTCVLSPEHTLKEVGTVVHTCNPVIRSWRRVDSRASLVSQSVF